MRIASVLTVQLPNGHVEVRMHARRKLHKVSKTWQEIFLVRNPLAFDYLLLIESFRYRKFDPELMSDQQIELLDINSYLFS
jgi:hypothetical protein